QLCPDIIGQVRDDLHRAFGDKGSEIDLECISLDHIKPAGIVVGYLGKGGQAAGIALDRDDLACPQRKDRSCQPAGAGSHLDDGRIVQRPGTPGDLLGKIEIEQEVLAERLARIEAMALDHVAQRRQAVQCCHQAGTFADDARASSAASMSAAMRLVSRAIPCPAMPNAVPWSGDVRMNGSPSVTLTEVSKPS